MNRLRILSSPLLFIGLTLAVVWALSPEFASAQQAVSPKKCSASPKCSIEVGPESDLIKELSKRRSEWENSWFGVNLLQPPTDLMIIANLIQAYRPDYIIETGTLFGGSAIFMAMNIEHVVKDGRVITIDINANKWKKTLEGNTVSKRIPKEILDRIIFFNGSSLDQEKVFKPIREKVKGKRVLVFLDSNHLSGHVLRELNLYSTLVPIGGYLLVSDTHLDKTHYLNFKLGPMDAVRKFLSGNKQFVVDTRRNRYAYSFLHSGILRRTN